MASTAEKVVAGATAVAVTLASFVATTNEVDTVRQAAAAVVDAAETATTKKDDE